MTESAKTGLICTKYTYSFYHIYLFFCVGYTVSVSFIEFLRKFCVYNEIFDKVLCQEKELLNLKGSKLGQILCADKTGFRRLGHIYIFLEYIVYAGACLYRLFSVLQMYKVWNEGSVQVILAYVIENSS